MVAVVVINRHFHQHYDKFNRVLQG